MRIWEMWIWVRSSGAASLEGVSGRTFRATLLLALSAAACAGQAAPASPPRAPAQAELDPKAIQAAVNELVPSIRQDCWQPQLDQRDANTPTSATLAAHFVIGADGRVTSVRLSALPMGLPDLAACIEAKLRTLSFAASTDATEVNLPLVFGSR